MVEAINASRRRMDLVGYVDDLGTSDELLTRLGTSRLGAIDLLSYDGSTTAVDGDVGYVIAIGAGDGATPDRRTAHGGRPPATHAGPSDGDRRWRQPDRARDAS